MWQDKMTQEEEEDLDELRSLDIREDHGDEDSDVTPINTPPSTPPILYIKKYPPLIPPTEDIKQNFRRLSRTEDYNCRTDSSLSWGDDEFEVESTKQVGVLFDQVDSLLYKEKQALSPLSPSSPKSPVLPDDHKLIPSLESLKVDNNTGSSSTISNEAQVENAFNFEFRNSGNTAYGFPIEDVSSKHDELSPKFFEYGKLAETKFNSDTGTSSEPSAELKEECCRWVQQFPHFRVKGVNVDPVELEEIAEDLSKDSQLKEEDIEEELIISDGDFAHLLPLVNYTSANQVKTSSKENSKRVTPSSRVCSGSNDPEVLKEQVLILLFEKLWQCVTKTVEPLLYQYARYIIEQSVQYLSISREPSTRGSRASGQRIPPRVSADLRKNSRFLMPTDHSNRPFSGSGIGAFRANRPSTGLSRPSSAVNRLQNSVVIPDIQQEELRELLQVSSKPLQNGEDRIRSRESSALSRSSQISLPSVNTPRDSIQRPISSKSTSRHLTPVKISNSNALTEQRPASTSSFNSRLRFQEKFHHLNRQGTIQELGTNNANVELGEVTQDQSSPPVWSRHIPFLPPISDNAGIPLKVQQFPPIVREEKTQPMLYVKGTVMSASQPRTKSSWGIPTIDAGRSSRAEYSDRK